MRRVGFAWVDTCASVNVTSTRSWPPGSTTAPRPRETVATLSPDVMARRAWAYRLISRVATPPPVFGSAKWLALPDGDHAKVAAVVISAECWARGADELCDSLAAEVEAARAAHKLTEDAEYQARAAAHRKAWPVPSRRTFVERRNAQLEAAKPRPGDWPGRKGAGA